MDSESLDSYSTVPESPAMMSVEPFPLLKLPAEVRLLVYEFYLQDFYGSLPRIIKSIRLEEYKDCDSDDESDSSGKSTNIAPLLFTNRQVYKESWPILSSRSIFYVEPYHTWQYQVHCCYPGEKPSRCTRSKNFLKGLQTMLHLSLTLFEVGHTHEMKPTGSRYAVKHLPDSFRKTNEVLDIFTLLCRKEMLRAKDGSFIKRTLSIDLGHIFRLVLGRQNGILVLAPMNWEKTLDLLEDLVLTTRVAGGEDVLEVTVHFLNAAGEKGRIAAEKFKKICETYSVRWKEVTYTGK